jgi:hypothetical protein
MTKTHSPIETLEASEVSQLLHAGLTAAERRLGAGQKHASHMGGGIAA